MRIAEAIAEGRPVYSRRHMKRNPGAAKQATRDKTGMESGGSKVLTTSIQQGKGKVPQVAGMAKGKESGSGKNPQASLTPRISGTQVAEGSRGGDVAVEINHTPLPQRGDRSGQGFLQLLLPQRGVRGTKEGRRVTEGTQ